VTLVWIALLVGLVAIVASIVLVVVRAIELWRTIRASGSTLAAGMDELGRRADALAAREGPQFKRLEPELERLRRSSAQLAVLRNAINRVRDQASSALVLYPRK
jgi:biopolymer transport protein ExbB/TolQ